MNETPDPGERLLAYGVRVIKLAESLPKSLVGRAMVSKAVAKTKGKARTPGTP
jgi:hypothetical protein